MIEKKSGVMELTFITYYVLKMLHVTTVNLPENTLDWDFYLHFLNEKTESHGS